MVILSIFQSVEFYVILTVVAAAVVALCARPSSLGPVDTHLLSAWFIPGDPDAEPGICCECLDSGDVLIRRVGLPDMGSNGTAALAITKKSNDLHIIERLTPSPVFVVNGERPEPLTEAVFTLDFLGQGWYHIKYEGSGSRFAAFSLHVRPGIRLCRPLIQ